MLEIDKTNMFLVALMILKKAKVKFTKKKKKTSNKYEQDWYISEIKLFIRLVIIATSLCNAVASENEKIL